MKRFFKFLYSIPKFLFWRLEFGKKMKMGKNCWFGRNSSCSIKGKSGLVIGDCLSVRNRLSLRVSHGGEIIIGKRCFFNNDCNITAMDHIVIGDDCIFGNNVTIIDHDHDFTLKQFKHEYKIKGITIGNNVWIGANAIILRGSKIGDNCVIGAGTIIKNDIPPNSIVYDKRNLVIRNKES